MFAGFGFVENAHHGFLVDRHFGAPVFIVFLGFAEFSSDNFSGVDKEMEFGDLLGIRQFRSFGLLSDRSFLLLLRQWLVLGNGVVFGQILLNGGNAKFIPHLNLIVRRFHLITEFRRFQKVIIVH